MTGDWRFFAADLMSGVVEAAQAKRAQLQLGV